MLGVSGSSSNLIGTEPRIRNIKDKEIRVISNWGWMPGFHAYLKNELKECLSMYFVVNSMKCCDR